MKILHSLLVAAMLFGNASFAMASPDRDSHDRRGNSSQHRPDNRDHGRYDDDRRDHRRRNDDRRDHRRHNQRRVVVYRQNNVYRQPVYRPDMRYYGHQRWRRGHRYSGPTYVVRDYGHYRLRQPPRGYRWVRAGNSDYLLVAIATGMILDIAMR